MITSFFSIGIIMLLSAMLPGPDFALVTKNTLFYSRRAGLLTTAGIVAAVAIHMTYCVLGVGIIISESPLLFKLIKYIGAAYLIYIGLQTFRMTSHETLISDEKITSIKRQLTDLTAFKQGFLCNLLNPKATLFFLALFTMIIKPETPFIIQIAYGIEMLIIAISWFSLLTILLSHARIMRLLYRIERYLSKILGLLLMGFGIGLALW